MPRPRRVALLGFSAFEKAALSAFLRLPRADAPDYEPVDTLAAGDLALADADLPDAVDTVLRAGRVDETVFIGSHAPAGCSAWTMRPIDPLRVLRELDAIVMLKAPQRMPTQAPVLMQEYDLEAAASRVQEIQPSERRGTGF